MDIGKIDATDRTIMDWAKSHGFIVFTHDLDFGVILAATNAEGPSVIQVRAQDVTPEAIGVLVIGVIRQYSTELQAGSLISVDPARARLRILPIEAATL
jgi:predicted nuclease of predicted toxin-antitoxin system